MESSSTVLDIILRRHLYFLTMVGAVNCHKRAHSTGTAKKENLIPFLFRCEHKLFDNEHLVLNKHSKIPGGHIGMFIAI